MDLNSIKVDVSKIEGGEWVREIPNAGDLELKVRGFDSLKYAECVRKKRNNLPKSSRNRDGTLPALIEFRISGEAVAETILLDWKGLTAGGVAVPFSIEKAAELLNDRIFGAFRDAVFWAATQVGAVSEESKEETLGNSAAPSSGDRSTAP